MIGIKEMPMMQRGDAVSGDSFNGVVDGAAQTRTGHTSVIRDKRTPIPLVLLAPHPADWRFRDGRTRTIYLGPGYGLSSAFETEAVEGARYRYSDDPEFTPAILAAAERAAGNNCSAAFYEAALRRVLNRGDVAVCHIMAGLDDNGAGYQVVGYISRALDMM